MAPKTQKRGGNGGICIRHGLSNDFFNLRRFTEKYKDIIPGILQFEKKIAQSITNFISELHKRVNTHSKHAPAIQRAITCILQGEEFGTIMNSLDDYDSDSGSNSDSDSAGNASKISAYDLVHDTYRFVAKNMKAELSPIDLIILKCFVTTDMLADYKSFAIDNNGDTISIQCYVSTTSTIDDAAYLNKYNETNASKTTDVPYLSYHVNMLDPHPHLYIAHIVSHTRGGAKKMLKPVLDVVKTLPTLQYIETDAVNPIAYHLSRNFGFVPQCIFKLNELMHCATDEKSIIMFNEINTEYETILKQSENKQTEMSTNQQVGVASLYKKIRYHHYDGVKLRLDLTGAVGGGAGSSIKAKARSKPNTIVSRSKPKTIVSRSKPKQIISRRRKTTAVL